MNLGITGHRPDKLWGYQGQNKALKQKLFDKLVEIVEEEKPDYGITGMAQGADQLYAEVCLSLGVPFVALVPFTGQESVWPDEAQKYYNELLSKAHDKQTVSPGGYATWKLMRRNKEIVWQSSKVIAIWDGSKGGTSNCVEFAEKQKIPIIRINPKEL